VTPKTILDLMSPRRLTRALTAMLIGFAAVQSQDSAIGSRLEQIRERGVLQCGVDSGLAGFATRNEDGRWEGFEADLCRAYAAALLGDARAARFTPLTTVARFDALANGEVDLLLRNTSWTLARDAAQPVTFVGVYYHDGQGFLAPADLAVASARELDGARICVQRATTSALNLVDYADRFGLTFTPVEADTARDALAAYAAGECDAFTNDISSLAGLRLELDDPEAHALLPDVISKEPLGPVVPADDPQFEKAVRWVLLALIAAEEHGVTRDAVAALAADPPTPEIARLLGAEGALADSLGLDAEFALRAVRTTGHYGELFDAHLGAGSPLGLERGLNAQWNEGGLLYAPPFR